MYIDFQDDNSPLYDLVELWNELAATKINPYGLTHHELAELTSRNPEEWKEFLNNPQVIEEINLELQLIQRSKLMKITQELDSTSKSTGIAQILATVTKSLETSTSKRDEGPAFIYTFVPPNPQEENAPNVVVLDHNPFIKND